MVLHIFVLHVRIMAQGFLYLSKVIFHVPPEEARKIWWKQRRRKLLESETLRGQHQRHVVKHHYVTDEKSETLCREAGSSATPPGSSAGVCPSGPICVLAQGRHWVAYACGICADRLRDSCHQLAFQRAGCFLPVCAPHCPLYGR